MPPVRAYAKRRSSDETKPSKVYAYMTHLRQYMAIAMKFPAHHLIQTEWITPFIIFDSIDETNQSRRLHRPVRAASNKGLTNQSSSVMFGGGVSGSLLSGSGMASMERGNREASTNKVAQNSANNAFSSSLSVASMSMQQNLTRSNPTLQQLREANDDLLPTPESQMSYKEMPPNAPPLPSDLKATMVRSGKTNR